MLRRRKSTNFRKRFFRTVAITAIAVVYGYFAAFYQLFPARQIQNVQFAFIEVFESLQRPWHRSMPGQSLDVEIREPDRLAPGLLMLAGTTGDDEMFIRVIDRQGEVVQEWKPSWKGVWGDGAGEFPATRVPKTKPGTMIHGALITQDGDVIANFEGLSTFRMNACGDVVWRLDNLGHHFVFDNKDGTAWVGGQKGDTGQFNHARPYQDLTMQKISLAGDVLQEISVLDVLEANRLYGLMAMSTLHNELTTVIGDTTHLNDADIFPDSMPAGIFQPGDMVVSLRNINTVLVFDPETLDLRFLSAGTVLRQHDADFIDGNRLIVFDNNNVDPIDDPALKRSRIAVMDARTGKTGTYFGGDGQTTFYSPTMGRQELLPNGNLLITSPHDGRAFEVSSEGDLLWQFYNRAGDEFSALLSEAHVLPQSMDRDFFADARAACN